MTLALTGTYTGKMLTEHHAGIQNIFNSFQRDFDHGADRDSGYIYGPTLPRTFYLGVKLNY